MPEVSFRFRGYVRGIDIQHVYNDHGKLLDVSDWSREQLEDALNEGEVHLDCGDIEDAMTSADAIDVSDYGA